MPKLLRLLLKISDMSRYVNPLTLIDSIVLVESLDKPFHIGPSMNGVLEPHHIKSDISDYKEYELEHGKEGVLTVFKRKGSYEIHHSAPADENGVSKSGEFISTRNGANPRFVATMGHVANSLIQKGHSVRVVGKVSNGMFDRYRRLGVILAKRYGKLVTPIQKYTTDHPDADDMKEFIIHGYIGESPVFWIKGARVNESNYDNDYWLPSYLPSDGLRHGFESE